MKTRNNIIISIIEDQLEIGVGLKEYINKQTEYICDIHYLNATDALLGIPSCKPDVVICDIGLPDMTGVECMKKLLVNEPETKFIMFTVFDTDVYLFEALKYGASGYILKDDSLVEIVQAINDVINGNGAMSPAIAKKVIHSFHQTPNSRKVESLTEHQLLILKYIADGLLNKEIADKLLINEGSVKVQISTIYKRLSVNNRVEAVNLYKDSR
ncbi:MAG: response regulator transcription factor [Saprospiraceae bacterium]|nr:response regulator transcription factor [Saprospiraceae bacterium]